MKYFLILSKILLWVFFTILHKYFLTGDILVIILLIDFWFCQYSFFVITKKNFNYQLMIVKYIKLIIGIALYLKNVMYK